MWRNNLWNTFSLVFSFLSQLIFFCIHVCSCIRWYDNTGRHVIKLADITGSRLNSTSLIWLYSRSIFGRNKETFLSTICRTKWPHLVSFNLIVHVRKMIQTSMLHAYSHMWTSSSLVLHKYKLHFRVDIFSYSVGTELVITLMRRRTGVARQDGCAVQSQISRTCWLPQSLQWWQPRCQLLFIIDAGLRTL